MATQTWTLICGTDDKGNHHGLLHWYLTEKQAQAVIQTCNVPITHSYGAKTYYDTAQIHLVHDAYREEWVVCIALDDTLARARIECAVQEK